MTEGRVDPGCLFRRYRAILSLFSMEFHSMNVIDTILGRKAQPQPSALDAALAAVATEHDNQTANLHVEYVAACAKLASGAEFDEHDVLAERMRALQLTPADLQRDVEVCKVYQAHLRDNVGFEEKRVALDAAITLATERLAAAEKALRDARSAWRQSQHTAAAHGHIAVGLRVFYGQHHQLLQHYRQELALCPNQKTSAKG